MQHSKLHDPASMDLADAYKYGQCPEEVEQADLVETITTGMEPIIDELLRAFEFFGSTSNSQVERMYLSGGGALIPGIEGLLSDRLSVPVEIFDPMESVRIPMGFDKKALAHMAPIAAVAMGLAARRFTYIDAPQEEVK